MGNCVGCGAELSYGQRFCAQCGAGVESAEGGRVCSNRQCGNVLAEGLLFCEKCGTRYAGDGDDYGGEEPGEEVLYTHNKVYLRKNAGFSNIMGALVLTENEVVFTPSSYTQELKHSLRIRLRDIAKAEIVQYGVCVWIPPAGTKKPQRHLFRLGAFKKREIQTLADIINKHKG